MSKIRQYIDPLPINRTAKAVLIEVCELVEHGQRGCCDAQNAHFVTRLGGSERTMTRALAELEKLKLVVVEGQGKARRITPTPALRAYYTNPTTAHRAALNLSGRADGPTITNRQPRQSGEVGAMSNLDKSGHQPRQKWSANLDKNGNEPRQKWFSTPYSSKEHNKQITITTGQELPVRERVQLENRIAELERENARLQQLLAASQQDAPAMGAQFTQPATTSVPQPTAELPAFEQFWDLYGKKVEIKKCRQLWQKLTLEQRQAALTHVPGYVRSTPDPQYRKNPRTYLHGECWQDELPATHAKSAGAVHVGNAYDKNMARANNQQLTY